MKTIRSLATFALFLLLPHAVSAQSQLDTSAATAFLGSWSLSFDSPQGAFVMELEVSDSSGKIAASVGSEMMGAGSQEVGDVSMAGGSLVLRYELDAQGQMVPVALTVAPDGAASMDFADGMFTMPGRGTKQ
jgi:hypothetical protein